jgi:hypothetical protein
LTAQITASLEQPTAAQDAITIDLSDKLSLRLYRDSRPCCLETGALQKGLVLLWDDGELIEEGIGFGVPVVKYADKTFFSSQAKVSVRRDQAQWVLTKIFILDTVSVKKVGKASYIDDALYSKIRKTFQLLYLKHNRIKPFFNKVMELRDLAHIKTEFLNVPTRGAVTVTYRCSPKAIEVQADLSGLTLNKCSEILLLNEQGSGIFQRYLDSDGACLVGNEIGAWEKVAADTAALQSLKGQLGFSVKKVGGAQLFRGYERTRKRFSWVGLSYSLLPNNGVFRYFIEFNCQRNQQYKQL